MKFSTRAESIDPFYVMEVAKAAQAWPRGGRHREPMIFLNIGEPDFTAPPLVQEAAAKAVRDGPPSTPTPWAWMRCANASAAGTKAASAVDVPARRIVVTAGAIGRVAPGLPGAD